MDEDKSTPGTKGHLFTIEVLMEGTTNGIALEKLLRLLNTEAIKDYKVKSGIELGKLIDLNVKESVKQALPQRNDSVSDDMNAKLVEQLEAFKQNNLLIRLTVVKGKGIKLNIPCRILNYDHDSQNVSVYHVDEKTVYLFNLNEIDDFVAG